MTETAQSSLFQEPTAGGEAWFSDLLESLGVAPGASWPDSFGRGLERMFAGNGHRRIRTLSLFSGAGGLDIGFHNAGFDVVEMVEINPRYAATLRQNSGPGGMLGDANVRCTDIRDYVPDPTLDVEFIIGGPPCQTFSAAGRRAAGVPGITDPRGVLFEEYVRILSAVRPVGFLFENVYGITGAQGGSAWRAIQEAFRAAGYIIQSRVLDAADYGVPQHRERLIIVGAQRGGFQFPWPTHGPDSRDGLPHFSAGPAVHGADTQAIEPGLNGRYGALLDDIPPGLNYSFYTAKLGHPAPVFAWRSKFSDFLYKATPTAPVRTIKAQGGQYTGPFSWLNRPFSIPELKRLQTFPDDYEIVGGRQVSIEQIGNSVPPQLARMLALSVREWVFGEELPFPTAYLPDHHQLTFRHRKRALTEEYALSAAAAHSNSGGAPGGARIVPEASAALRKHRRYLSANFLWTKESKPNATAFRVAVERTSDRWLFSISRARQSKAAYTITLAPQADAAWQLGCEYIDLISSDLDLRTFTAIWKALEEELQQSTRVADLVQLNGYYQYSAQIRADMSFPQDRPREDIWRAVENVIRGVGVAHEWNAFELGLQWGVYPDAVLGLLRVMRGAGYEVRDHATNPQIISGNYLIPYLFPTLNPKSVQLRKSLTPDG